MDGKNFLLNVANTPVIYDMVNVQHTCLTGDAVLEKAMQLLTKFIA